MFDHYLKLQNNRTGYFEYNELSYETFAVLAKNHFSVVVGSVLQRILLVAIVFPFIGFYLTDILMETPLARHLKPVEDVLPSILLSLLLFLYPYGEALIVRRVLSDRHGFAELDMKGMK